MNQMFPVAQPCRLTGRSAVHDSAEKHVTGEALYVDDLSEPKRLLHAYVALSEQAHARVSGLDLAAVAAAAGVVAVMQAADIPGVNDVGPAFPGDPIFAGELVEYRGQSLFAVAAENRASARAAAALATVRYEALQPTLTIDEAMTRGLFVLPSQTMRRGDSASALSNALHKLQGRIRLGGQEHFYLEGQVAMAVPGEGGDMRVYSSTQHPTEVQHLVARSLGVADHSVVCETRRMGGGFGGKESQASLIACVAGLLAQRTGRPVKLRLDRESDMLLTGKRHDFRIDYAVGFDDRGLIDALEVELCGNCGMSPDLSGAINDRAMLHVDNCYYLPHVTIVSHRCKTNTVSNTAFRGFGGPQGMFGMEYVIDEIARYLRLDPLEIRSRNFYGLNTRNITPYCMKVEDNVIHRLVADLVNTSQYEERHKHVASFNRGSQWIKRGIALTPVKFGISFTLKHLNQAGALIHVYTDGSVQLNHGGTEMGQGLFVKVAQVVADIFGLPLSRIKLMATATDKVPNTSPTAASSGFDLNGKAAAAAAHTLRARLTPVAAELLGVGDEVIEFRGGMVWGGEMSLPFAAIVRKAYEQRIQLSATGYYATPKIHYDRATHTGQPFLYFSYGASVSEVEVDTLTGEYRVVRTDILHDVGRSINPALDIGQIEGGFVQGMGWLTTEELKWDDAGKLLTHAPSTYKIPVAGDVPTDFRVRIWAPGDNREDAMFRSKAVGEPPLMHGISVFHALKDAVAACGGTRPALDAPATPERVLMAIKASRGSAINAACGGA